MGTRHLRDQQDIPQYETRRFEEALIANTPIAAGDDLFVILAAGSHQQRVGPVRGWQPHQVAGVETLPARGDTAFLARGDSAYWLLTWEAQE